MKIVASFSDRLKTALEISDMKPTKLSDLSGINKSTISQYIQGIYQPKRDRIRLFAEILNVDEAWLTGYDVPMKKKISLQIGKNKSQPDIMFPDGRAFEFKKSDGKIFIYEYNINDNPIQFKSYELTPEEEKDYNKILGMNMFFFEGEREVDDEDRMNLEKTLLTIFIKNYFKKHSE